jgi:hypothetical protein
MDAVLPMRIVVPNFDVVTSQGKSAHDEHLPFVVALRGAPPTASMVSPDVRPLTNESDLGWTSSWRSERGMVEFNHVTGSVRVDGDEHVKAAEARTLVLLVDASEPRSGVQRMTVAEIRVPTRYRIQSGERAR